MNIDSFDSAIFCSHKCSFIQVDCRTGVLLGKLLGLAELCEVFVSRNQSESSFLENNLIRTNHLPEPVTFVSYTAAQEIAKFLEKGGRRGMHTS